MHAFLTAGLLVFLAFTSVTGTVPAFATTAPTSGAPAGGAPAPTAPPSTAAPTAEAPAPPADEPDPVLVFGAAGLSWSDISPEATPHLWSLAETGAIGNLTVRSLTSSTCPGSGWLTLGAGRRAADTRPDEFDGAVCPQLQDAPTADSPTDAASGEATGQDGTDGSAHGSGTALEGFEQLASGNAAGGYSTTFGLLGDAARSADVCVRAIGDGAGYAAVGSDGIVDRWESDGAAATQGSPEVPGDLAAGPGSCPVTLVDLGSIASPRFAADTAGEDTSGEDPVAAAADETGDTPAQFLPSPSHEAQVAAVDAALGAYLDEVPLAQTQVFVAGLADSARPSRLRAVIRAGSGVENPGYLGSTTTRQDDLLQLTDLSGTVLTAAGITSTPAGAAVDPLTTTASDAPVADRVAHVQADATRSATIHKSAQTFSVFLDVAFYVLVLALGVVFAAGLAPRRSPEARAAFRRIRTRVLAWVGLVLGCVPMGSFLAGVLPWSRFPVPEAGLGLAIAAGTLALVAVAVLGPWRHTWRGRITAVSLVTAVVLAGDIAVGSHLQYDSLMGYNPIVAGRFYGLGNQGVAVFIVAVFLALGVLAGHLVRAGRRTTALWLIALVGLASVGTLGNPAWGAKFGGTIAVLAGFLVLAALVAGIRLNIWRLGLIGLVSLGAIVAVAGLDHLRPESQQSHFGRFFGQALSGELFEIIGRKLGANLNIVAINPALAIVLPLALLTVLVFLSYLRGAHLSTATGGQSFGGRLAGSRFLGLWDGPLPDLFADRTLHHGFLAIATALGVGLVITDSGVAVPATGAFVLVPFLLALAGDLGVRGGAGTDASDTDASGTAEATGAADRGDTVMPGRGASAVVGAGPAGTGPAGGTAGDGGDRR